MGRRVFYAEPVQLGERAPQSVDFRPAMLAGESIPAVGNVSITVRERESGANFDGMLVSGSVGLSDNVVTFQVDGAAASDNYDYVATVLAKTNLRPDRGEEADVVIPVRSRPRRAFSAVGP